MIEQSNENEAGLPSSKATQGRPGVSGLVLAFLCQL